MSFVRALYVRSRYLIREAVRFGMVGLVVTDSGANLLRYQAGDGAHQFDRDSDRRFHRDHFRRQPLLDVPAP